MRLNKRDVLDYLGYQGKLADGNTLAMIDKIAEEIIALGAPKSLARIWDCRTSDKMVEIDGLTINSSSLTKHLTGCSRLSLIALTLDIQVDRLIRRYSVADMSKAIVADAIASVMVDAYCDELEMEIAADTMVASLKMLPRFSPGYGDFDIAYQKDILGLLDAGKQIGLTLTDGYMLVPSKSVTAVIGFYSESIMNHYIRRD
ncbi:MAG: Vitamin B12 dependent methionine synthase activation subunit [Defluviitaleaceae bacterium]|nr:Vitamin B12 dependent methionine synthase activation subunit [Defluviitaleaceae bacterium]